MTENFPLFFLVTLGVMFFMFIVATVAMVLLLVLCVVFIIRDSISLFLSKRRLAKKVEAARQAYSTEGKKDD